MSRSIVLAAVLVASCADAPDASARLVLTGSSTVAPLMTDIAARFEAANPGTRVDVQTGGSARGIADARGGAADIGMVSRALKADESDLRATTVALDGLALILHKDNPVAALSDEQVKKIYRGEVTDWSALGGAPGKITVVHKAEGRSTLELFLGHLDLKNGEVKPSVVIGDNEQGIKTVSGNPGAIGYVSVGVAETDQAAGVPVRALPLDLRRELNLVTKGEPSPLAKQLLDFAVSPAVKDILDKHAVKPAG